MSTPLDRILEAVDAGFDALDHFPHHPVTVTPVMADTFLPLAVQEQIVSLMGPIPQPPIFGGSMASVASGFKVVIRFGGPDGCTWTETYAVPGANAYDAATRMNDIAIYRCAFLAEPFFIDYIRASDVTKLRASITLSQFKPGILPVGDSLAQQGAAIEYQIFNGIGGATLRKFRGLPAKEVKRSPMQDIAVAPDCDAAAKNWIAKLAAANIGYFPVTPVPRADPASQFGYNNIASINGEPFHGSALITTQNDFVLSDSQMVQISLVDKKLYPGINGIWKAERSTANSFYIPYQVANNSNLMKFTGRMRVYQLQAIQPYVVNPPPRFYDNDTRKTKSFDSRGRGGRRAANIRTLA